MDDKDKICNNERFCFCH